MIWLSFTFVVVIFPFHLLLYLWSPAVTRKCAKISCKVVFLRKGWKYENSTKWKNTNSRPFVNTMSSSRLFEVITFLCFTNFWNLFQLINRSHRRGIGHQKESVVERGTSDGHLLFSSLYILHVLFRKILIKTPYKLILQVAKWRFTKCFL